MPGYFVFLSFLFTISFLKKKLKIKGKANNISKTKNFPSFDLKTIDNTTINNPTIKAIFEYSIICIVLFSFIPNKIKSVFFKSKHHYGFEPCLFFLALMC